MTSYIVYLIWAGAVFVLYRAYFRGPAIPRIAWVAAGLLFAAGFGWLAYVSRPPHDVANDFHVYYRAGEAVFRRPQSLVEGDYGFVNVPILALVFWPFAQLEPGLAVKVFGALGVLAVAAAYAVVMRMDRSDGRSRYWALAALVGSGPLVHSMWYGNASHLVLLPLAVGIHCLGRRRDVAAGILFALCSAIKLPLLLLGPFLFLRGRWLATFAFGATTALILGSSVLMFGPDLNLAWLGHVGKFLGKVVPAYNVQSVTALLIRLAHDFGSNLRDWGLYQTNSTFKLVNAATLLGLLAGTVIAFWRAGRPRSASAIQIEAAAVLCLALALSSLSWSHYYVLLWLPVALLVARWANGELPSLDRNLLILGAVLLSMPVVTDPPPPWMPWLDIVYRRLFISHAVLGGLTLLLLLVRARLRDAKSMDGVTA